MLRFFAPFIAPIVGALFVLALACAFFSHRDPTALQPADKYHREPNEVHYSFEGRSAAMTASSSSAASRSTRRSARPATRCGW